MTDPIDDLVAALARKAEARRDIAYGILGAVPTGRDLVVKPDGPCISGWWLLHPISEAGRLFLAKFYPHQPLNDTGIARAKHHATDWGLGIASDLTATEEGLP